ncbi:MAG: hypothetical protein K6T86_12205 [Pirellulales bacterium]|nr:hypothetical protein [Pirellulales bacterium]
MYCQICGSPGVAGASQCAICGGALAAEPLAEATLVRESDATGGLIPYKNPRALLAYYLGIVAMMPLIGLPFGIAAYLLGRKGLREAQAHPEVRGRVHAWIGILLGGGSAMVWTLVLLLILVSLAASW